MNVVTGLLLPAATVTAGLLLPGLGWAWGRRWPAPGLAAFLLSVLAVFGGLLACALSGLPVGRGTLGGWLAVVAALGLVDARRRCAPVAAGAEEGRGENGLLLLVLPLLAVAVWRAATQPLSGPDVDFRWNYLAEQIVQQRGLAFYPPASGPAFAQYFWADGIAPLVAGVYAWTYLGAGTLDRAWTFIPVVGEVLALLGLVWALGREWGGRRGAGLACALAGATMLLQFSFNLGQETGFTALGVGGMALYLLRWTRTGEAGLLVPAAACAAVAACAREYGAVFGVIGAGWIASRPGGWRRAAAFAAGAAVLPLAWHARVWVATGNPLYPHHLGGLFPDNPVFRAWMDAYAATYGAVLHTASGWRDIGAYLLAGAGVAMLGLVAGAWRWRGEPGHRAWLALAATTVAVWLVSVPLTAGGVFYSMRVLSPLFVLGCAWGGAWMAPWLERPAGRRMAIAGLALLGVDASLKALTVSLHPFRQPPSAWLTAGDAVTREARVHEAFLRRVARETTGRTLSESAGAQRLYRAEGRELVPFWSPEVAFAFRPDAKDRDAVARLRALGFSRLLLTRAQATVDFLTKSGALAAFEGRLRFVVADDAYVVFAFD